MFITLCSVAYIECDIHAKNEDEPITISLIQSWYVKSKKELIIKEGTIKRHTLTICISEFLKKTN